MNITMACFKKECSDVTKVKRREPDKLQRDSTLADTVLVKLPNLHEDVNEFGLNNLASGMMMIPYIHLDPSPTTICLSWKMPKPCGLQTYIFIEKKPTSNRAGERRIITCIEHLPANGIFQYLFTNLPPGKTFKFRIKAFNSVTEGPFSTWVEKSTLYLTPEPPGLSCVEWSHDSLTLSWQNVLDKDILHYVIEMQTAMGTFKKIYEGPKQKFKLAMLKADTDYHFRICAAFDQSRALTGPYSTPHTFSTSFRLIGDLNQFIKAFGLWKYNNELVLHFEGISSTIWSQLVMRCACKYERETERDKKDGIQNFGEMVRFAVSPVPSAINNITIYSLINSFYLSWTEPTFNSLGIRSYNIEFQASNNVNRYLLNTRENLRHMFLLNLESGTTYNIRIQAVNEFGQGYFTEILQAATLHKIPQPPELKCKPGETYLELEWDIENPNGVLSYRVELQGVYSFFTVYLGPSYSCVLDMLAPDMEYFFRISAFCSAGRSGYSKLYCFKTLLPQYKPEIYGCRTSDEDSEDSKKETVTVFPSAGTILDFKFTYHPSTEKTGVEICTNDFKTLNAFTFLNDAIIEFYLKYLYCEKLTEMEKEKIYFFSSFFFSKLLQFGNCPADFPQDEFQRRRHESVKHWTRKCDIFSKDFLILPINESNHWVVAIICFPGLAPDADDSDAKLLSDGNTASSFNGNSETEERNPCICIFDSFSTYSMASTHIKNYGTMLREYMDAEWTVRKGTKKIFNTYTVPDYLVNCPQQPNGFDCGIFMLQNVETFFENQVPLFQEDFLDLKSLFSIDVALKKRQEIKKLILEMLEKI